MYTLRSHKHWHLAKMSSRFAAGPAYVSEKKDSLFNPKIIFQSLPSKLSSAAFTFRAKYN